MPALIYIFTNSAKVLHFLQNLASICCLLIYWCYHSHWCEVIPLLGIYPKKPKILLWKNTSTPMFIAALFTITKIWNQPKCPSVDEWTKLWDIYTMEYYLAIKKKKTNKYHMSSLEKYLFRCSVHFLFNLHCIFPLPFSPFIPHSPQQPPHCCPCP